MSRNIGTEGCLSCLKEVMEMGICPNCGSWVDEGDICGSCGGGGGYTDDRDLFDPLRPFVLPTESIRGLTLKQTQIKAYELAAEYYTGLRDKDALKYINSALELDNNIPENLSRKGAILKNFKRFEESEEYFNRALELSREIERSEIYAGKARMLYDWSSQLVKESRKLSVSEALDKLKEAKMKIEIAIDIAPGYENIEKYLKKKNKIESLEYSDLAWKYYNDYKYEDAFYHINLALDLDDTISNNWNRKGIILEGLKRFEESEKCYNKSLELSKSSIVSDNKARMLYDWSSQLVKESEKLSVSEALDKLKEAKNIIERAIDAIPEDSEEDIKKYTDKRDEIDHILENKGL